MARNLWILIIEQTEVKLEKKILEYENSQNY